MLLSLQSAPLLSLFSHNTIKVQRRDRNPSKFSFELSKIKYMLYQHQRLFNFWLIRKIECPENRMQIGYLTSTQKRKAFVSISILGQSAKALHCKYIACKKGNFSMSLISHTFSMSFWLSNDCIKYSENNVKFKLEWFLKLPYSIVVGTGIM